MVKSVDVVVIGAGASSAAFCWRLSQQKSNLEIVCIEQGGWVEPTSAPSQDEDWELAGQTTCHPNPNVRQEDADYPVNGELSAIQPANYNAVGGSTIRWGAHFPRLHPSDFCVASLDGVGADWPLDYADLEPYYHINDEMMGVCGLAGDPANPPRPDREFPPLPLCEGTKKLQTGFEKLGWHWWPSDAAITTRSTGNRQACNNCGPCGLGCTRKARASVDITYWPDAINAGVTLKTGCTVLSIKAESSGTTNEVELVEYRDEQGQLQIIKAKTVVIAASGLGTPRLLLSSIRKDPNLAPVNASGQLGRNLMLHPTAIVTGVFKAALNTYRGAFACALYSQEFYETDKSRGFARGFQMQAIRGQGPLGTAMGGYMNRIPWGQNHSQKFESNFDHDVSLTVTTEDLPVDGNYIDLDEHRTDSRGLEIPRMHYSVCDNTQSMLNYGIERAKEALYAAGAHSIDVNPLSRQAGFHIMGTARMGTDPRQSVVDEFGRCHAMPNLIIIDGSVFPSAAAVNPTPTIQAVALRCADALLDTLLPISTSRVIRNGA